MNLKGMVLEGKNSQLKHLVIGDMEKDGVHFCVVKSAKDLTIKEANTVFDLIEVYVFNDSNRVEIYRFRGTEEEKQKLVNEIMAL
jgi:adenylate cyclase